MMNDPRPFGAYAPTGFAKWVLGRTRAFSSGWAPRRVAFMLRRLAVQALKGQPVDVVSLGARMRLYPYNNVCEKRILFTPQFFDPEELALLESRIVPGFTFVDVGANVGGYSLFVAARAGGSGPDPRPRAAARDLRPPDLQYPPESVRHREGDRLRGSRQDRRTHPLPRPAQPRRIERQDRQLQRGRRHPRPGHHPAGPAQPRSISPRSTPSSSTSRAPRTSSSTRSSATRRNPSTRSSS